jgi:beta-barrel assembly-enhancing protease
MKPIWALSLILMIAIAGFCLAPRSRRQDVETPGAVLHLTTDFERDRSQMPIALRRLPRQSEVLAGGEVAEGCLSAESAHPVDMQIAEKYVRRVGDCVASRAHQRLPCRFHLVVKLNLIDAFPGGHVSVGLGLLHQRTCKDEVDCVLGPEIEHLDHDHAAERIEIEAQLKMLDRNAIAAGAEMPLDIWQAGYSKAQELEADGEGFRLAAAEGYRYQGANNLIERWAQLNREYVTHASTPVKEPNQIAIDGLQGYLKSHPLPEERSNKLKR